MTKIRKNKCKDIKKKLERDKNEMIEVYNINESRFENHYEFYVLRQDF